MGYVSHKSPFENDKTVFISNKSILAGITIDGEAFLCKAKSIKEMTGNA